MRRPASFIEKNFMLVAVVGFLVVYGPLLFREQYVLRQEILRDVEAHTGALTALLKDDLQEVVPLADILGDLDNPDHYRLLDYHVRQKLGYLGLTKVLFYDLDGKVIYSTEPELVGRRFKADADIQKVLAGGIVTELIDRDEYLEEYGIDSTSGMIEVYMPIYEFDPLEKNIVYVLESYHDFLPYQQRIRRLMFQSAVSLALVTVLCLSLLAVLYFRTRSLEQQVKTLEKFLPICSHCKKIRVEKKGVPDRWVNIETYFGDKEQVDFTHGICDECIVKYYPEMLEDEQK